MLLTYFSTKPNLRNGKSWAPLFFEDVKTNASIAIDVRVEDLSPKCNLKNRSQLPSCIYTTTSKAFYTTNSDMHMHPDTHTR
jgi:hypothetical protein